MLANCKQAKTVISQDYFTAVSLLFTKA